MLIEQKIENLEQVIKYLSEKLDTAYKTIHRINNVDTYDISDYEIQNKVDDILERKVSAT